MRRLSAGLLNNEIRFFEETMPLGLLPGREEEKERVFLCLFALRTTPVLR
jgi:hypothetical protein